MKSLFIIAGPNGAGKTTTAFALLEQFLAIHEYVNADAIAAALSPFNSESVAISAGRLMLERIHGLLEQNKSFAFETTLASRSFVNIVNQSKKQGYKTNLLFLWLESPELAIERVKYRVEAGGHDIPEDVIIRRYKNGLKNLFNMYMPIVDNWMLYDNSKQSPDLIVEKAFNKSIEIFDQNIWQQLHAENVRL